MIDLIRGLFAGKKTYIVAALAIGLNFGVYMNWITVEQLAQINTVLGFLGVATIRAGIAGK